MYHESNSENLIEEKLSLMLQPWLLRDSGTKVKLVYNELVYNKLSVIKNTFFQSQIHANYINQPTYNEMPVITKKFGLSKAVCYNRVSLY